MLYLYLKMGKATPKKLKNPTDGQTVLNTLEIIADLEILGDIAEIGIE